MLLLSNFILLLATLLLSSVSAQDNPPVVDTTLGKILGFTTASNDTVDAFLGIQYATVEKRFQPSTLADTPWQSPLNATSYGSTCWQALPPGSDASVVNAVNALPPQDEDCLFLNIWRPHNTNADTLLPVMVYIHGGGFNFGSGSELIYNGEKLAARDQYDEVIVVTLNYRLGMFGFLVQNESGLGGLNGIHDQIQALTWVHNHIQAFGGDPDNVTIFGESAGSMSVCMLNVSPLAKGLFHRSIQQSGECAVGLATPNTAQVGAQNTETILNMLNASSVDTLSNATLYPAAMIAPYSAASLIGWHTVDGWVLPKQPRELYSEPDSIVPTDMIVGSNSYDGPLLVISSPSQYIETAMNMETEVKTIFGEEYGAVVLRAYSPSFYNGNQVAAYTQFWGDFFFRCASRQFAALVADFARGNVYLYNYAHLSAVDPIALNGLLDLAKINDTTWASHAADVPMIFHTFNEFASGSFGGGDNSSGAPTEQDVALSQEMRNRWIRFAQTGNPNIDGYKTWDPVPLVGANSPGPIATSIPTFALQEGGGVMMNVETKVQQCSVFGFSLTTENTTQDDNTTQVTTSGTNRRDISCSKVAMWLLSLLFVAEFVAV